MHVTDIWNLTISIIYMIAKLDYNMMMLYKILFLVSICCLVWLVASPFLSSFIISRTFHLADFGSIGDLYLKKSFNREPLYAKFRLPEPFKKPILSAEPTISVHQLDQFIIFASDGLRELLSNDEAVNMVQSHPRSVRYIPFHIKDLFGTWIQTTVLSI